jgi:HipA-like protein
LTVIDGRWRFEYSEEFRRQKHLRPIVGFGDLVKTYESDELWPFFAMRIPGLKQTAVQDIIRKEHIDATNEVQLLRRFGRRTVANPFELVEDSEDGAPQEVGREAG